MKLRDWLIPQDKIFFELLSEQVSKVLAASEIFCRAIISNDFDQKTVTKIKKLESECDQIVHEIFKRLNRTFITPIDHEDIGRLAITCDDLIDLTFVISRRLEIYQIDGRNKTLLRFAKIIKKMFKETSSMVLKSSKLRQKLIVSHAQAIHKLENEADNLVVKGLKDLFLHDDPKRIIKEKEIYELMESLTDRIEDFCDLIQGIVTKNL